MSRDPLTIAKLLNPAASSLEVRRTTKGDMVLLCKGLPVGVVESITADTLTLIVPATSVTIGLPSAQGTGATDVA